MRNFFALFMLCAVWGIARADDTNLCRYLRESGGDVARFVEWATTRSVETCQKGPCVTFKDSKRKEWKDVNCPQGNCVKEQKNAYESFNSDYFSLAPIPWTCKLWFVELGRAPRDRVVSGNECTRDVEKLADDYCPRKPVTQSKVGEPREAAMRAVGGLSNLVRELGEKLDEATQHIALIERWLAKGAVLLFFFVMISFAWTGRKIRGQRNVLDVIWQRNSWKQSRGSNGTQSDLDERWKWGDSVEDRLAKLEQKSTNHAHEIIEALRADSRFEGIANGGGSLGNGIIRGMELATNDDPQQGRTKVINPVPATGQAIAAAKAKATVIQNAFMEIVSSAQYAVNSDSTPSQVKAAFLERLSRASPGIAIGLEAITITTHFSDGRSAPEGGGDIVAMDWRGSGLSQDQCYVYVVTKAKHNMNFLNQWFTWTASSEQLVTTGAAAIAKREPDGSISPLHAGKLA